jgi:hypothetical protein
MQLAQRLGAGGNVVVAGGTKAYSLDRWQIAAGVGSSATVTQLTNTGLLQFQNALRMQRTSGNTATTAISVAQSMESVDSYPLQGQVVNVSFMARAGANYSPTGNALTAALYTGTGTDENVLTGYTGSVTAITQTFNITNNWLPYTTSSTLSSVLTEFGLAFTMNPTGTAGTNDYVDLDAIQVELGPSASTFDVRPFSETLARCQRYYQKSFAYNQVPVTGSNPVGNYVGKLALAGANQITLSITPSVPLRTIATGVVYNPSALNNQIRNIITSTDFSSSSVTSQIANVVLIGTAPAGSSAGDEFIAHWSVDAEL